MIVQLKLQTTLASESAKLASRVSAVLGHGASTDSIEHFIRSEGRLFLPYSMVPIVVSLLPDCGYHVADQARMLAVTPNAEAEKCLPLNFRTTSALDVAATGKGSISYETLLWLLLVFTEDPAYIPRPVRNTVVQNVLNAVISQFHTDLTDGTLLVSIADAPKPSLDDLEQEFGQDPGIEAPSSDESD